MRTVNISVAAVNHERYGMLLSVGKRRKVGYVVEHCGFNEFIVDIHVDHRKSSCKFQSGSPVFDNEFLLYF